MAFSNTPVASTYSTKRLTVVNDLELSPGDAAFQYPMAGAVNVLPFTEGAGLVGETRNALTMTQINGGGQYTRGMYVWEKTAGTVYYFLVTTDAITTKIWTSTTGLGWAFVNSYASAATTPARFTEFIDATNVKKLVMVDGLVGYVFTSNAAGTQIVDVDFPSPHVPFPVFMDGYLFLAKANTGDIYNSDLNDPAVWTAGSFISAEVYPDDIQALVKINNYILAIGAQSCEYFYDAANPTASPLARYEGSSLPFGTIFPNSIAANKDTVMMLANNNDGETFFKVIEGFKHGDFPAVATLRTLSSRVGAGSTTATKVRGSFIRQNGDLFYVFMFDGIDATQASTSPAVAASMSHKIWTKMATGSTGALTFPVAFSAPAVSGNMYTFVAGSYLGFPYFGYLSVGVNDSLASSISINNTVYIAPQAFDTMNRKFMSRFALSYVRYIGSTENAITVYTSDDMMYTFSTGRNLDGSTATLSGGFPFLTQLGSFRQRGFQISTTGQMRWYFAEVDINKGQQ